MKNVTCRACYAKIRISTQIFPFLREEDGNGHASQQQPLECLWTTALWHGGRLLVLATLGGHCETGHDCVTVAKVKTNESHNKWCALCGLNYNGLC